VFENPLAGRIASFLQQIGIEVRTVTLGRATPCPGVWVERGVLLVDEAQLAEPGDLLHEAGHIAVCDPAVRAELTVIGDDPGEEMAAIAWSYAAASHLGIDPRAVFHDAGYGGGGYLVEAFQRAVGPGVPMLAWFGMTPNPKPGAAKAPTDFPHMLRWIR
jgi:hypothetical protein